MAPDFSTQIMGILNITPDSFYDGGRFYVRDKALAHAEKMLLAGADILDVGGESTRPGSKWISLQEELDRVLPVLEALKSLNATISIDTCKAAVAEEALRSGAEIVNDISALRFDTAMPATVAKYRAHVVLMHMKGTPISMQEAPYYEDVLTEIRDFLTERRDAAEAAGIERKNIILDPGIGFGKRTEDNIAIVKHLNVFLNLGCPLLIGGSRKRLVGDISGTSAEERLPGSLAIACAAALKGAHILRVHDVAETVQALKVLKAIW